MMTFENLFPFLATAAALLMVAGFLQRDKVLLHTLAMLAGLAFAAHFILAPSPHWPTVLAALGIAAVNLWSMWRTVNSNRTFQVNPEEMMLYAKLPGLSPGQFRQLLAISHWQDTTRHATLTTEGEMPSELHYVLEGKVDVNKEGKVFAVGPHAFIGELAFLRGKPAVATTTAQKGALIVSWNQQALRGLISQDEGIGRVFNTLLSTDMAEKIVRTPPPIAPQKPTRKRKKNKQ